MYLLVRAKCYCTSFTTTAYEVHVLLTTGFNCTSPGGSQATQIGTVVSEKETVVCGCPQGSILGPLLFQSNLLYINDNYKASSKTELLFIC